MTKWWMQTLAVAGVLTAGASGSFAQTLGRPSTPNINTRPAIPPILGLNRNNAGLNYLTQVRPQVQTYQALQNLQTEINDMQAFGQPMVNGQQQAVSNLPITGHPATFMNYGHYYSFNGIQTGGSGIGGVSTTGAVRGVQNTAIPLGNRR